MSNKSRLMVWATLSAALLIVPKMASAQTLPSFTTDIVPIGLSLTVVDQKVTSHKVTTETDTFAISSGFNSTDFTDNLIDLISSGGTFEVGVAPNGSCRTGEPILTPISIPMADVSYTSNSGVVTFTLSNDPDLSATWTTGPFEGSGGGSGQSTTIISCNNGVCTESSSGGGGSNSGVSCINGTCVQSGSGGSVITNSNGSVITESNSGGGSSGPTPSDQLNFKASSTVPGVIPLPQTAVDVFFLYPDGSPSGPLLGGCITLHSTSVNNQTRSIFGTTTVTRTYVAN
jgi:hypothetical protein